MTKLLDEVFAVVRKLPPGAQDDIAGLVLRLVSQDDSAVVALTREERTAIDRSKAAAARGDFATDEQVQAVWAKHAT
jgi:hypothetical protein